MGYQKKFLDDGVTPNPKHRPDSRKGDRHTSTTDRHTSKSDRHAHTRKDTFIGIDGEGITLPDKTVRYVLLCASTGEYVSNPAGLTTSECFTFLLDLAKKYRHGIFCIFSGSYDFNLWIRNLAPRYLKALHDKRESGKDVQTYALHAGIHYGIGCRARKFFYVGKIESTTWGKDHKPINHYEASIRVHDVFDFFQKGFVTTLRVWFDDLLHDGVLIFPDGVMIDLHQMQAMKATRRTFTVEQLQEEILPYCLEECQALARLMERLRDYLNEAEIPLSRYEGAGAIASAILRREQVDAHVKELPIKGIPAKLTDPALYRAQLTAYHAGRFEASHFGTYTGPVFNYDLHSAFPSVMPDLPSMRGGMWRHVKGMSHEKYALVHVRWQLDDQLSYYPFPWRDDQGSISYPNAGEGWYYRPEIDAALRAWHAGKLAGRQGPGRIEILESWEFHPATGEKPFAFVPGLYQQRQQWKQEDRAAEKVIKLGLNSMYGKMCQSVGAYEDEPPRFHNIFYAGWITSAIRARLFDAVMLNPEKVVMLAADGLYSTEPLDLDEGPGLGQWELRPCDGLIIVQRGVYWGLRRLDRDPLEQEQTDGKHACIDGQWYRLNPHHQGYDAKTLTIPAILGAWTRGQPSMKVPTPDRFVTLASAMALRPTNELRDSWLTWRTVERTLELFPKKGKRVMMSGEMDEMQRGKRKTPDARLIATHSRPPSPDHTSQRMSQPYKLHWVNAETDELEKIDGIDRMIVLQEIMESEA